MPWAELAQWVLGSGLVVAMAWALHEDHQRRQAERLRSYEPREVARRPIRSGVCVREEGRTWD